MSGYGPLVGFIPFTAFKDTSFRRIVPPICVSDILVGLDQFRVAE